jgi:hypothetical protein
MVAALAAGLLVLGGYFFPLAPLLSEGRALVLEWAVIVGAFALLLGLVNIVQVHGRKIVDREQGWIYSVVLLLGALAAWIPGILPISEAKDALFAYVLGPLGSALAALLLFTLVLAGVRLLRVRLRVEALVFLLVAGVVLLGSTPLAGSAWLAGVREWLVRIPGAAGTRGLLLGVAIGTMITGLRVVFGSERPHAEPGTALRESDLKSIRSEEDE